MSQGIHNLGYKERPEADVIKMYNAFVAAVTEKDSLAVFRAVSIVIGERAATELARSGEFTAPPGHLSKTDEDW